MLGLTEAVGDSFSHARQSNVLEWVFRNNESLLFWWGFDFLLCLDWLLLFDLHLRRDVAFNVLLYYSSVRP